jgi:cephalosporin-C deacetylase-like acetyl esterase
MENASRKAEVVKLLARNIAAEIVRFRSPQARSTPEFSRIRLHYAPAEISEAEASLDGWRHSAIAAAVIAALSIGLVALPASAQAADAPAENLVDRLLEPVGQPLPPEGDVCRQGVIYHQPPARKAPCPDQFKLKPDPFRFLQTAPFTITSKLNVSNVTFPSPVTTPHEKNNTVHCEYYRPTPDTDGKVPGVIVLHILGGDFALSRVFCLALSNNGVAALFVKMPYYGPRRQPGVDVRMVSSDPRQTVAGMTQAVLDIRRAAAWLAAQKEIDREQIGICGVSLGGIMAALAATAEPRISKVCPILAGGDVGRIAWESAEVRGVRDRWVEAGGTQESLAQLLRRVDPVTYAANVKDREILMLNAKDDEVIPRACTESLWEAFGRPRIVWLGGGHYSAARNIFYALRLVVDFFKDQE